MKNLNNDLKSTRTAQSGTVGYTTVANAMPASRDAAPYLGQTHVGGSYTQDDVARRIAAAKGCQFGVEEIKRVWNAVGNLILNRMPEELCAYDLGFVRVQPAIGGSFPSMDAAFDAGRNRVYVAVTPSDAIRDAVAESSPTREGTAGGEPDIFNVTWDGATSQTIKSGEPFKIYGNALTLNVGDESAALQLPGGAGTVDVAVSAEDEGNWQRLNGELAHAVEACEGALLVVNTHGYDPDSGLKPIKSRPLTVLAGVPPTPVLPPTITSAGSTGSEADTIYCGGGDLVVEGDNLETATQVQLCDDNGTAFDTVDVTYAEGRLTAPAGTIIAPSNPGTGLVKVTTPGGTATRAVTYVME